MLLLTLLKQSTKLKVLSSFYLLGELCALGALAVSFSIGNRQSAMFKI